MGGVPVDRVTVVEGDITELQVDAIVNAANESLLGGGGVDGAIHQAAGPGLLDACRRLGGCRTGDAKITAGFNLSARFVIHTVGPVWHGGDRGEDALLASCYIRSLELAEEYGIRTIAFPAISTGAYGFPLPRAVAIAVRTVLDHLSRSDRIRQVTFVAHGRRAFLLYRDAIDELAGESAPGGVYGDTCPGSVTRRADDLSGYVRAQVETIEEVYGIRFAGKEKLVHTITSGCGSSADADIATAALNSWVALTGVSGNVEVPPGVLARILDGTVMMAGKKNQGEENRRRVHHP